jgi:TATA-box binding protein (TBP) (component of TFIID and TFIIIB)
MKDDDIFIKLKDTIEYDLKPDETNITTMTICLTMKENIQFKCFNIGKYLKKDSNIDDIIFCDENNEIKTRKEQKKKKKKKLKKKLKVGKQPKKDSFYNQVTIVVKISDIKNINIKLFKNGSIQMTGCDSLDNAKKSINIVFNLLNTTRHLLNFEKKEIKEITFIKTINNEKLNINDICKGKVVLINSVFNIGFQINRDKLYEIISNKTNESVLEIKKNSTTDNIDKNNALKYIDDCTFDPIRHACVNIKLKHPSKIITIFVFESGSIIILAKTCRQIKYAYNYINVFLLTNYFCVASKNS